MKLNTLITEAPTLFKAGISGTKLSLMLEGPPGCGKSQVVEKQIPAVICEDMGIARDNFAVVTVMLTCKEEPDIGGFTIPVKKEDGTMVTVTSVPDIVEMIRSTGCEYGVLFFDETYQASMAMLKAVAPAFNDHRLGNEELPPGWVVWGATNRPADNAGVIRPPMHLLNRVCTLGIEPDIDAWVAWAVNEGLPPIMLAFPKFKPGLFVAGVPSEAKPYCTARSYVEWCTLMIEKHGDNIDETIANDPLSLEYGAGLIGEGAAAEAVAFMRIASELPTYEEIVTTPEACADNLPRGRLDIQHAAAMMLAYKLEPEHVSQAFDFINKLPREMRVSTVMACYTRMKGALSNTPEFKKFAMEHNTLIMGSTAA